MRGGAPWSGSRCGPAGFSVAGRSESLCETLCIVMVRLARGRAVKGHRTLGVCPVPATVPVHQRPCLSPSSSASVICGCGRWRLGARVCFAFSGVARGGGGWGISACDSVVVCLSGQRLAEQTAVGLDTVLPSVCSGTGAGASDGEGDLVEQKGRDPPPSVTTDLAGRAARGQPGEAGSAAWDGNGAGGGWGTYSGRAASPSGTSCPLPPALQRKATPPSGVPPSLLSGLLSSSGNGR